MGNFTKTGPFTDGGSPGISAAAMNNIESAIASGGMIYFLSSPYQAMTNVSFTSGQVQTFTMWGNGGIPSGALAILFGEFFSASVTGVSHQFAPHGGTLGNYFNLGNVEVANAFVNGFGICPLDAAGKIDIKSSGGASVSGNMFVYAYIM